VKLGSVYEDATLWWSIGCAWPVFCSSFSVLIRMRWRIWVSSSRPLADWYDKPVTLTYARQNQRVNAIFWWRGFDKIINLAYRSSSVLLKGDTNMSPPTGDAGQQTEDYLDLADGIIQGAGGDPSKLRGYLASLLQQSDATNNEMKELRRLVAAKQRDNRMLATGLVEERRQREDLEGRLIELRAKLEGSGARRLPLSMPETMAVVREQVERLPPWRSVMSAKMRRSHQRPHAEASSAC
jgi:hypothetical protein